MHRPTTTAALLVTVAVSALTGCVTAQHPSPSGASPVPSRPSGPRPDGTTETQIVQAPAREALELVGPPREATPATPSPSVPTEPSAPAPAATPTPTPPTPTPPTPTPPPPPSQFERPDPPERPGPPPRSRPHVEIPPPVAEAVPTAPPKNSGVCALGHKYGGWGRDTPQAAICKDVYGR